MSWTIDTIVKKANPKTGVREMTKKELSELEALRAKLAEQEATIAAMKKSGNGVIRLQVSAKGALSLYGIGRFPVTLYAGQWEKVLAESDNIKAFIKANKSQLSFKEPPASNAEIAQQSLERIKRLKRGEE